MRNKRRTAKAQVGRFPYMSFMPPQAVEEVEHHPSMPDSPLEQWQVAQPPPVPHDSMSVDEYIYRLLEGIDNDLVPQGKMVRKVSYPQPYSGVTKHHYAQLPVYGQQICADIENRSRAAGVNVRFLFAAQHVAHPIFAGGAQGSEWVIMDVRQDPNMRTDHGYAIPRSNLKELKTLVKHQVGFDGVFAFHQLAPESFPGQPWPERVLPPPPPEARNTVRTLGWWTQHLEHALKVGAYTAVSGMALATVGIAMATVAAATTIATIDPIIAGQINLRCPGTRPRPGDPCMFFYLTAWDWTYEVKG